MDKQDGEIRICRRNGERFWQRPNNLGYHAFLIGGYGFTAAERCTPGFRLGLKVAAISKLIPKLRNAAEYSPVEVHTF